jgi:hypothetical protein
MWEAKGRPSHNYGRLSTEEDHEEGHGNHSSLSSRVLLKEKVVDLVSSGCLLLILC